MELTIKITAIFLLGLTVIYIATFEPRMWVRKVFSFIYTVFLFCKVVVIDLFNRIKSHKCKCYKRTDIERYVYPNKNRD